MVLGSSSGMQGLVIFCIVWCADLLGLVGVGYARMQRLQLMAYGVWVFVNRPLTLNGSSAANATIHKIAIGTSSEHMCCARADS